MSDADRGEGLSRAAGRIGALTMLSRVLGLARETLLVATFGAGPITAAYAVAFRIPNLLRDLFAEGALTQAFVPTFVKVQREEGRERAFALANRVLTALTVYLGLLAALVMIWPAPIVALLASGFDEELERFTGQLLRIMMPFLAIISVAVAGMGILNAERRYTAPALGSSIFNVVAVVGGAAVWMLGITDWRGIVVWAWLTVLGGIAQLGIQVPSLRSLGFRARFLPDLLLKDPATRTIAKTMAPAALAVAAVQVNVIINTQFASYLEPAAIVWLNNAFRLMQLPIGVFGVAVGTVATTELARNVAAHDNVAVAETLRRGLRLVWFLTVPSTVGLALLAGPIMSLIFEHGKFGAHDTAQAARALVGYTVGLAAYSAIKVLAPIFYALGRPRIPLVASVLAVAVNFTWNVFTWRALGHFGLALGTSVAATVNFLVLAFWVRARVGRIYDRTLVWAVARVLLATGAMAAAVLAVLRWIPLRPLLPGIAGQALAALAPIALGGGVYFAAAMLLRLPEARALVRRFR